MVIIEIFERRALMPADVLQRRYLSHVRSHPILRHADLSACVSVSPRPHPIFSADHDTPAKATFPIAHCITEQTWPAVFSFRLLGSLPRPSGRHHPCCA